MYPRFLKTVLHFSLACGVFLGSASLLEQKAFANTQISVEKAKEIVLNHANITDKNVFFSDVELDTSHGRTEYEIEFFSNNKEYDYEIDAMSGKVTSFSQKMQKKHSTQNNSTSTYIGDAKAKEIALKHAKLTTAQIKHFNIKFEKDNGEAVYDVDLYTDNAKYEYEIDAITGMVIEFGKE